MRLARLRRSVSRVCAVTLTCVLLFAQVPAASFADLPAEPITFSARTPASGSTIGMSNPDVSVKGVDTAGHNIIEATATIDGARATVSLVGSGTAEATATFPTYDLTQGLHTASVTFLTDNGGMATDTWTFSVAPAEEFTLTFNAGPHGSLVGSSTQTVTYGTDATELEGFEDASQWTPSAGAQSTDTVNVLHGPASLRLTGAPGSPAYSYKSVTLDLSSSAPLRLYFYLAQDPEVARPDVGLSFLTAGSVGELRAAIPPERLQQGWNSIALSQGDFASLGGATWTDTFKFVQVSVKGGLATCDVSFDSLYADAPGRPMVAVTFDDARQSAYELGFPQMLSRGIPGTMYTIPTRVGDPAYMTVPQLGTMQSGGWDVANHSWDHTPLTTLTPAQAEAEVTDARDWLIARGFVEAPSDVAYPFGSWDATTVAAMSAARMRSARTTTKGDTVLPLFNPYQIRSYTPPTVVAGKGYIDLATAHQSLVVLLFHAIDDTPDPYNFPVLGFQELMDYLAAQPVAAVRMSDVVDRHSNDGFSVTAVPEEGYHFVGWSDGVATATRHDTDVTGNITATATFAINTYDITATSGAGGAVNPPGVTNVDWNGSQAYTVDPDPAHRIFRVFVDGASVGPIASYSFSEVKADHTIEALFGPSAPEPMVFSARAPAAGSTVGMSNPDVSVRALDTAGNKIIEATATIDGARATVSLVGSGTTEATATFPTYDLTQGLHDVSVTFTTENGAITTDSWSFSVAPAEEFTLTYNAGAHGSIVGSSTQTVTYGTDATSLEDFDDASQWTVTHGLPSAQSTDTINVLHGPASLRLTAFQSNDVISQKNVSLNLSSSAPFRLYFYLAQDPTVTRPDITLTFANDVVRMTSDIPRTRLQQGWNSVSFKQSDFTAFHGASWSDTFTYLRLGVSAANPCDVSFDSLNQNSPGMPMVAITFDDGLRSSYDNGYSYMASKGLVGTMYTISTKIGTPDYMTVPQLQTMQTNGWNIANHTWDHTRLTTLTQEQQEAEFIAARDWLIANGFPEAASDVAYPNGAYNDTTLAAMSAANMRSGRSTVKGDVTLPLFSPYQIKGVETTTVADAKAKVDWAAAHQSLVPLLFHGISDTPDPYNFPIAGYREVMDYIAAQPVAVVRMSDVVDRHSNDGLSVTAVADEHYHFVDWSDGLTTPTRHDTNVTADASATANFTIDTYTLAYTAGVGGSIVGSSTQVVDWNSNGTEVTATPLPGYRFDAWSDGVLTPQRTDLNVTADKSVSAVFVKTWNLTAVQSANGTITPAGVTTVDQGADATYTVTAAAHYHPSQVTVDGGAVTLTDGKYVFADVSSDHTLTASFALDTYTVAYTASGGGSIEGSATQVVGWGLSGTEVTATPAPGHHFVTWSDGVPTPSRIDTDVVANKTVDAEFAIDTFTLTYSAGANGSIVGSSTQVVDWNTSGTEVVATPAPGYDFVTWSDGVPTAARTDASVTATKSVSASFAPTPAFFPVWRFRQLRATGSYLWTSDPNESAHIQADLSKTWLYEGVAFNINRTNPVNNAPLWRFRNRQKGSYLYTADPAEKANIQNNLSKTWIYEGPTWNVSLVADASTTPVWRFRCLKNTTYLWTSDPNEKLTIETTLQSTYKLEGVAYYIGS